MLAEEGPLLRKSVPFISTLTSRATTSPPISPTSSELFRSAMRRRESTSHDPRGLARTRRLYWNRLKVAQLPTAIGIRNVQLDISCTGNSHAPLYLHAGCPRCHSPRPLSPSASARAAEDGG